MSSRTQSGSLVIVFSFFVALLLTGLPLPDWAQLFRPNWVALVLVYWCLALPTRVGVGTGWIIGLVVDVMTGGLLGQNALGLAIIAFLTNKLHQRIRVYPLRQQSATVLLFLLLERLICLWIMGFTGRSIELPQYFLPALIGTLLWPWIFFILRDLRRHFRVG